MTFDASPHPAVAFAVLAIVSGSIYRHRRHLYALLWGTAFAALFVRHVVMGSAPTTAVWRWTAGSLGVGAGVGLLLGAAAYVGRRKLGLVRATVLGAATGAVAVILAMALAEARPGEAGVGSLATATLAACSVAAGWIMDRHGRARAGGGARLAGVALAAWGALQPVLWAYGVDGSARLWLAGVDAALAVFLVVGIVLLAMEEERRRADAKTRERAEEEVRAINQKLERTNVALEKSNRLKSEFLSNTSHELKTPLTSIIANAEILEYEMYGPVNDEQRRVLANIERNSQHLLEMISRLLDFGRLEGDHEGLRYELVDLDRLIDGVMETARPLLEGRTLRLTKDVAAELEPCWMDGEKIYRVYLNLVENAIKFSDEGTIRIGARRDGEVLEGWVSDEGMGIATERMTDIFEAFRQGDASATRTHPGVGLGLAICRQLVGMHGGTIRAESTPGEGSRFVFSIPLLRESPVAAGASSSNVR